MRGWNFFTWLHQQGFNRMLGKGGKGNGGKGLPVRHGQGAQGQAFLPCGYHAPHASGEPIPPVSLMLQQAQEIASLKKQLQESRENEAKLLGCLKFEERRIIEAQEIDSLKKQLQESRANEARLQEKLAVRAQLSDCIKEEGDLIQALCAAHSSLMRAVVDQPPGLSFEDSARSAGVQQPEADDPFFQNVQVLQQDMERVAERRLVQRSCSFP